MFDDNELETPETEDPDLDEKQEADTETEDEKADGFHDGEMDGEVDEDGNIEDAGKESKDVLEQATGSNEISETEAPDYLDSNAISPRRNTEDPYFYDGGKSSKEIYAALAENIPEVRERLAAGESVDNLCADERLGGCANAYFKEDKMLTVRDNGDGNFQLIDDGNHRLKAAQDLGYEVPVKYETKEPDVQ